MFHVDKKTLLFFIVSLGFFLFAMYQVWFFHQRQIFLQEFEVVEISEQVESGNEDYISIKTYCGSRTIQTCIAEKELQRNFGLQQIYSFLSHSVSSQELTNSKCHFLSHVLGSISYVEFGLAKTLGTRFSKDVYNGDCISGFYHGAIIESAKSNKNEMDEVKILLEPLLYPKSFLEMEIVHGVGHAIYAAKGDIGQSIEVCTEISKNKTQQRLCASGVFMQNFLEQSEVGIDNDISFCLSYQSDNRYACISSFVDDYYTDRSLVESFLPICLEEEGMMRSVCLEKLILNLAGFDKNQEEKVKLIEEITSSVDSLFDRVEVLAYSGKYVAKKGRSGKEHLKFCSLGGALEFLLCMYRYTEIRDTIIFLPKPGLIY